mgnify:CR=1 FL=1
MDSQDIPVLLRVRLAHAVVQAIADECGADLLHIKGPAVDASLPVSYTHLTLPTNREV